MPGFRFAFGRVAAWFWVAMLAACVSPKVVEYTSFHSRNFAPRAKPAEIQNKTTAELLAGGYLLIGYMDLRRNVRTCYDDGQCVNHSDTLPSRDDMRQEAAQRGGDVVTMLDDRTVLERNDKSYCISFTTTTVMVNNTPQIITTCSSYRSVPGKLEAKISRALIWRNDPEAARTEANADAINAALKTLEAVTQSDEAKANAGKSNFWDWITGPAKKNTGDARESDELSKQVYAAIQTNDRGAMTALARSGKLQNWKDSNDRTALMIALATDHFAAAQALLTIDKGVDRRDKSGLSALHYAAARANVALMQELVSAGYDLNAKTPSGASVLFYAVFNPDLKVFEWLRARGLDPRLRTAQGETLPMVAAEAGRLSLLRRLLELGVDINERDNDGRTVLMAAARGGQVEAVRLLGKSGVRANATDNFGNTALHYAAHGGKREVCRALIDLGLPVNAENKEGGTPLMTALVSNRWDAMRYLMEHGASLTTAKASAEAVGSVLISKNQAQLLERYATAFPSFKQLLQRDPRWLQYAAKTSGRDTIKYLADLGARVNHPGADGLTPLMTAAQAGNAETLRALLALKADPTVHDRRSQTALKMATMRGHADVVQALREYGVRE